MIFIRSLVTYGIVSQSFDIGGDKSGQEVAPKVAKMEILYAEIPMLSHNSYEPALQF